MTINSWVDYLCLSSFTDLFVKFFVCTRLTVLSWLFVFIVIYQPFCQVFRMYQTYSVELTICVYRHLPIFCQVFRMYQTYWVELVICVYRHLPTFLSSISYVPDLLWVELTICVYRHLPTFLSSFSYVPDLLGWVGYLCLSSFTDLFVKFFVCTRLTAGWVDYLCLSLFTNLFVKFFVCTRLTALSLLFVFIVIYRSFCQVFRMYQTYWVELTICVYRHLPIFLSSVSYVPDLLGWVGYLCLSSFTDLFQFFRMYQTYWVELAICVYRHLPTFLSSFSYVPDLLGWVGYLCLLSFTDLFVKFFVCTRLTALSWLFVFIVIYQTFCQVFRMYQTYWVEVAICVYRHLPTFLSSFSYVPDLLGWVGYLCLSSFTDLFVKFFVCTRLTGLSWLFVFIVIYRSFCQVFRMYQTYCWVDYLCLSSFTNLFLKFFVCTCTRLTGLSWLFVFIVIYRSFCQVFVCTRLTVLSWLFVFIVIYRPFCQVFRMYQTYCVELAICVYRHLPIFLSSFSYVPDLLGWVGYLCLSSFTDLFVKFFVYTRLTVK